MTILWCLLIGVLVGLLVYFIEEYRRGALDRVVSDLRAAAAASGATLEQVRAQLEASMGSLNETRDRLQELESARTRLSTELELAAARVQQTAADEQRLRTELERSAQHRDALYRELTNVRADHAAQQQIGENLRTQLESQKTWVADQTRQFEQAVVAAAAGIMEERGKAFTEINKREVDAIVTPLKEKLSDFRQRVDEIYAVDNRERGQLHEQIRQLTSLNQSISAEAQRLTNALTITSKTTGDWGETILEKLLEDSGLRRGREYELQYSIVSIEGERLQPDAVIFLPENRQLIIDAKVSNKAWTQYCNEQDEAARKERFEEHLQSLRAHVKGLAAKDYARTAGLRTVDFVLMFVPVEAALLAALAKDENLYAEAYRSKIVLVTPSTLLAVVKLVEGIWTFQKRKESADEIAELGRKLLEKLSGFANTFVEVGSAIAKAQETFEKARGQLASGKGNAISLAQRMVNLGVTPGAGKALPAQLLGSNGGEEADPDA